MTDNGGGMFAKLYGTDDDQILVKTGEAEDGSPELRIFFKPPRLGVCSFAISWDNDDAGWSKRDTAFNEMNEEHARQMVAMVKLDRFAPSQGVKG